MGGGGGLEKNKIGCYSKRQEQHVQRCKTTWQVSRYVLLIVMVPEEAGDKAGTDQKGPQCCMEGLGLTSRSSCRV